MQVKRANAEIRSLVSESGITYKAISERIGITPEWLSKLLSKDLTDFQRNRIMSAVTELSEEKRAVDDAVKRTLERMRKRPNERSKG